MPFVEKTLAVLPTPGADENCDAADAEVERIEAELVGLLQEAERLLK
jgi:DNA mismatch repair protein MSH6